MLPIDLLEVVSEVISRNGRGLRGRFVTTQYSVNCPPSLSGIHCITNFRLPKVWPLIIYKLMVITKSEPWRLYRRSDVLACFFASRQSNHGSDLGCRRV